VHAVLRGGVRSCNRCALCRKVRYDSFLGISKIPLRMVSQVGVSFLPVLHSFLSTLSLQCSYSTSHKGPHRITFRTDEYLTDNISDSHGEGFEDECLVGCDAV
jgi:hypothetical protein